MVTVGSPLAPEDYAHLAASWITPELAAKAEISRLESYQGADVVGRKDGSAGRGKYSGLAIPNIAPGATAARGYRLKLDNPEYEMKDGVQKPKRKYLAPPGTRNQLYFVPGTTLEELTDSFLPIVLVEGEKKALAAYRLARHERETPDYLACAVTGVWNWKGTIGKGAGRNGERIDIKGVIPDFGLINWNERTVYVVFDADYRTNDSVAWARKLLARELAKRGARVMFVDIPEESGVKAIDDLLVAWGPLRVRQLFDVATIATATVKQMPHNYAEKNGGLVRYKALKDSVEEVPLTNFTAHVTADIQEDDGAERRRLIEVEVNLYGRNYSLVIPAAKFQSMDFHLEHLGPDAIVYPNQKDYARTAIQSLSLNIREHLIFTHTGWRKINDVWVYLHGDGAIGRDGAIQGIDVRLSGGVGGYKLVAVHNAAREIQAIQASLHLLKIAQPRIAFPILAAAYRSALKIADFGLWVAGPTGAFKSELAALVQQHFGAAMNARHLPGNFASTANALEMLAFLAKDSLLVVDDFAPHGGQQDVARYHATADRLIRAGGNNQGRARLTSDVKLREPRPPRCLVLVTGEDLPKGQSIRGRTFIITIGPAEVDVDVLTECQKAAASGLCAESMGGFVQYIAGRYDDVQARLEHRVVDLRAKSAKAHSRTPGIAGNLQAGFEFFTEYAATRGAITEGGAAELNDRCWQALNAVAHHQAGFQGSSEPAQRYVELIRSAISSGGAHIASMEGEMPLEATHWGWCDEGSEQYPRWVGKGRRIGWRDGDNLYLDPVASYATAQELGQKTGEPLSVTQTVISKRCQEAGLLISTEKDSARGTLTIRKVIQGSTTPVLHFSIKRWRGNVGFLDAVVSPLSDVKLESDSGKHLEICGLRENGGNVGQNLPGESLGNLNGNPLRQSDLFAGQETEGFEV